MESVAPQGLYLQWCPFPWLAPSLGSSVTELGLGHLLSVPMTAEVTRSLWFLSMVLDSEFPEAGCWSLVRACVAAFTAGSQREVGLIDKKLPK